LVHLNLAALQQPENLTLEPDGSADLTFAFAAQVARVTRHGQVSRIAQLPIPRNGHPPLAPPGIKAVVAGIVRASDGTLYVNLSTGTAKDTGVWRIRPGAAPARIAALPPTSFANGLALDQAARQLYVADSANQVIWRIPLRTDVATVWARGSALHNLPNVPAPGVNGIKVIDGAVWATNTARGTLLRIPITRDHTAGKIQVITSGLPGVDDFSFAGRDTILAAINFTSKVALIHTDGRHQIVLTAKDGLSNPTATAVRGHVLEVTSAAYYTKKDPNLLIAQLHH
jgi:sugar lactone lactonase YvrE